MPGLRPGLTFLSHNNTPQAVTSYSSADAELSKVYSFEKKQALFNILHSDHPDHYSRLWLAGFLKFVGYSLEEICDIIHVDASWGDYDPKTTWLHVRSVFRSSERPGSPQGDISLRFSSANPSFHEKKGGVVSSDLYSPLICEIMSTHIECYFKQCATCPISKSVLSEVLP